jgi:phosphopantothenoylcysteine decarboxylase/phosphopantothenate--cysteine ligase
LPRPVTPTTSLPRTARQVNPQTIRFLITAGPTREFIDPIRYISNRSSGKMGYALARAARRHGRVTLISGPVALRPPARVEFVPVISAAEMAREVFRRYRQADIVIMAAAVCDFRPRSVAGRKIKKHRFRFALQLVPTVDILAELGRRKRRQLLVGFAAETGELERHALQKLRRKRLDMIVANDVRAFEADRSRAVLLTPRGREALPEMPKSRLAREIVRRALALARRAPGGGLR